MLILTSLLICDPKSYSQHPGILVSIPKNRIFPNLPQTTQSLTLIVIHFRQIAIEDMAKGGVSSVFREKGETSPSLSYNEDLDSRGSGSDSKDGDVFCLGKTMFSQLERV